MRRIYNLLCVTAIGMVIMSCENTERTTQEKGFRIPKGDVVVGETLFKELQCYGCHSIAGVEAPKDGPHVFEEKIPLGGSSFHIKSYGELVTSIIDPSHSIASSYLASLPEEERKEIVSSPMVVYNEDVTVQELIDLAAFLHSKYVVEERPLDYYYYPY